MWEEMKCWNGAVCYSGFKVLAASWKLYSVNVYTSIGLDLAIILTHYEGEKPKKDDTTLCFEFPNVEKKPVEW